MACTAEFDELFTGTNPVLALAPMQDVTDREFWELMARYGGADVYFTEYFRVHSASRLDRKILSSITENPTGRPAVAQMIGNDIGELVRTARELEQYPVVAVDLNLGCPAPVVYRKCAGGGLLRDLPRVDAILGALRDAIRGRFTVKTRLGFDDERTIGELLPIFSRHSIDLLSVHGRTVTQMYRDGVRYDLIGLAVREMKCPVIANGNVSSASAAMEILAETNARGLMVGRGAVRNPWIFAQIRQAVSGTDIFEPTGRDVLAYVHDLYDAVSPPHIDEGKLVQKMKKYANFLGAGIGEDFLYAIRRVQTRDQFFAVCAEHLDFDERMTLDPLPVGV